MPEGHTIHGIARTHREAFAGGPVTATSPQGRFGAGAARLSGRTLETVDAYGKHLFYRWERRVVLHVHLGLVGKFQTHGFPAPAPSPATRLALSNPSAAAYLTGPMTCRLIDRSEIALITARLGPDPLRAQTRVTEFVKRIQGDRRALGAALLDQKMIAGIGNVYRSEIPYLCGIDPATAVADLSGDELAAVWSTARGELRHGLEDGTIITVRPRDVGAARRRSLPPQLRLYAYKRQHQPCLRCRTPIAAIEIAGRMAWWCPSCQPAR